MTIPVKKRISTWINGMSLIVSAAMIHIPDMGLDGPMTAKIMCACAVLVAGAQWYKQEGKDD